MRAHAIALFIVIVTAVCDPTLGQPGLQLPTREQKAAQAIRQYCSSGAFKAKTCGWGDDAEEALTGQCLGCGNFWWGTPGALRRLPMTIQQARIYYQYAYSLPSLACKGPAVVRAVFKQQRMDWQRPGCADWRLEPQGFPEGAATPVVRCELALPGGGGSENERALRSKEVNCRVCTSCASGGGCPNVPGKWYSDSFVVNLGGCAAPANFGTGRATLLINPGTKVLLAKFEVCQAPGCFDPAAEAAKLKGAKKCVGGKC